MASIDWMPGFMLNVLYVLILITTLCRGYYFYGGGHSNLARPHTILKEKSPEQRPCIFILLYFILFLSVASYFVKPNLLNTVCQMGQCKCMWSHCKRVCLHRWGRPGMQTWLLAQETMDPLIPGRKESGNGRHRAAHLRHVYFLQLKLPVNHSISFISPFIHSLNISRTPTTPDIWKGNISQKRSLK